MLSAGPDTRRKYLLNAKNATPRAHPTNNWLRLHRHKAGRKPALEVATALRRQKGFFIIAKQLITFWPGFRPGQKKSS